MPRIDLDQQVGAAVDAARTDVRYVEQRREQRLRMDVVVDGELGEFGKLPAFGPQPVADIRIEAIDEQAVGRIEADGDRADDAIGVGARQAASDAGRLLGRVLAANYPRQA